MDVSPLEDPLAIALADEHARDPTSLWYQALVLDDTNKRRSKTTKRIAKVHKLKDKATGGFFMGQSLVVLLLVTETLTLPVAFAFYEPDPALSRWYKQDKQRKKQGLSPRQPKPPKNPLYPSKLELALSLLGQFKHFHPQIKVKAILADALYGTSAFLDAASALFDGAQVISQLRREAQTRSRRAFAGSVFRATSKPRRRD